MQATVVAQRGSRALVGAATLLAALVAVVVVVAIVAGSPATNEARLSLAGIPQGVSLQRVDDHATAILRDGDSVVAYIPAIPVGDTVVWCAGAHRFTSALHATHYSLDGRRLSGPGPSNLVRYTTHVIGDHVIIDLNTSFDVSPVPWTDALQSRWTHARDQVCAY